MIGNRIVTGTLFTLFILIWVPAALASFDIESEETIDLEIKGYEGLDETTLFLGQVTPGMKRNVATTYRGLALLTFAGGQAYPIVTGKEDFLITIASPETLPTFTGSAENEYLYSHLKGVEPEKGQFGFPGLMIQAKQLLDSTGSIKTTDELQTMKENFHSFVRAHHQDLYHSDMLRRLIAQYFMMHEYVDYHRDGFPATDIQRQYQSAVLDGVRDWLSVLSPSIPDNEVLNYIVSLYYNRSMVSLASLIISNFPQSAYCPGEMMDPFVFSEDLKIINGSNDNLMLLGSIKGDKIIAIVADYCSVSLASTVNMARKLKAEKSNTTMIVAPVDELSDKHLSMRKMISGGHVLFIIDGSWKENLTKPVQLPFFQQVREKNSSTRATQ